MYALFPLLIVAIACGMLGAWLVYEAGFVRNPALAVPGRLLIAVLPLVLLGFVAASVSRGLTGQDGGPILALLLGAAALLLLLALGGAIRARLQGRRAGPARPGMLGPTLLVPAVGVITLCYVLSLLLALTNGTLRF